jgi:hypothetical protein
MPTMAMGRNSSLQRVRSCRKTSHAAYCCFKLMQQALCQVGVQVLLRAWMQPATE